MCVWGGGGREGAIQTLEIMKKSFKILVKKDTKHNGNLFILHITLQHAHNF